MFEGDTWLDGGIIRPVRIEQGTYDPYTGAFAWVTGEEEPRMVAGIVDDAGELFLFWPGASKWGIRMAQFGFKQFQRIP